MVLSVPDALFTEPAEPIPRMKLVPAARARFLALCGLWYSTKRVHLRELRSAHARVYLSLLVAPCRFFFDFVMSGH